MCPVCIQILMKPKILLAKSDVMIDNARNMVAAARQTDPMLCIAHSFQLNILKGFKASYALPLLASFHLNTLKGFEALPLLAKSNWNFKHRLSSTCDLKNQQC